VKPEFEYLVCTSQCMKVTFINNEYAGRVRGDQEVLEVRERMYDTCADLCDFLQLVGKDGWELVAAYALPFPDDIVEKMIFKRRRRVDG
jgi:hypothetical protein